MCVSDSEIIWGDYQEDHITRRHRITREMFRAAWHDRVDADELEDPDHGPYAESYGFTEDERLMEMVWRWWKGRVWPITAYFPDEEDEPWK
jgi:hypothetical protein